MTNRSGNTLSIGSATPVFWSTTPDIPSSGSTSAKSDLGAVVGAIVGGVVLVLATLVIFWTLLRRRRRDRQASQDSLDVDRVAPVFIHTTPFIFPVSSGPTSVRSDVGSPRPDSKFRGASVYDTMPGTPGMSSRGSLDVYRPPEPRMLSGEGSNAGWASVSRGSGFGGLDEPRESGSAYRDEVAQHYEVIRRDR